jgi:GT2 family glycosyltransferase
MFKHNDFLKLKGLNQNLKVRGYEEMEFSERFLKSGGRIIIDDDIKTIHLSHPKSLDKTSQISWNLYNSTVSFNPAQKIGTITDATFREFPIL